MASNQIELNNASNREKIEFISSLFEILSEIKNLVKVEDIYVNLFSEKLEIYIFVPTENIEDERTIYEKITQWEAKKLYFPEVFIYQEDELEGKMNILPRSVLKVC